MKHDVMSFRSLIDEMKAVAAGETTPPDRPSRTLYGSEQARTDRRRLAAERRPSTRPAPRTQAAGVARRQAPVPGIGSIAAVTRLFTPQNQRLVSLIAAGRCIW